MIVSDNGTEFTSNATLAWAQDNEIVWHFIAPGKPMQNGFCESFNGPRDASTRACSLASITHGRRSRPGPTTCRSLFQTSNPCILHADNRPLIHGIRLFGRGLEEITFDAEPSAVLDEPFNSRDFPRLKTKSSAHLRPACLSPLRSRRRCRPCDGSQRRRFRLEWRQRRAIVSHTKAEGGGNW